MPTRYHHLTHSPKVFISLTHLCHLVCDGNTFIQTTSKTSKHYMHVEQTCNYGVESVLRPFLSMNVPHPNKGKAYKTLTVRESILMRAALNPFIASWAMLGEEGVAACIKDTINRFGRTLRQRKIFYAEASEEYHRLRLRVTELGSMKYSLMDWKSAKSESQGQGCSELADVMH